MHEIKTPSQRGAELAALPLAAASGKELFAIQLALQERNQQAARLLLDAGRRPASGWVRGIEALSEDAPVAILKPPEPPFRRPKPPAPSELRRPAQTVPQGLAAFLGRFRKPAEYLDLTA